MGTEQEDVPGRGLDGEVLVHRADGDALGIEYDPVVAGLGDGAATGEGGQPGAAPGPEPPVDGVVVQMGAAPAAAGLDPPRDQLDHPVEVRTRQLGVGGRPADEFVERSHLPLVGARHFGDQLLGQHVQRGDRRFEEVEVAGPDPGQQGHRFHQLVAGHRVEPAGRRALQLVVGPSDPLEEGPDGPGRADLAHQLHRTDVDAQLERGRGHQGPEVAGSQALLDDAAAGGRQAAVMGRHLQGGVDGVDPVRAGFTGGRAIVVGRPEPRRQLVGDPLGHLAGVDEDEGGPVLAHVVGDAVEHVGQLGAAGHRLEFAGRQLDGHVQLPPVTAVDDGGGIPSPIRAREEPGHHRERPLGGREADPLQAPAAGRHQLGQAFEGEGEVGAALVAGQGVHLVDDDGVGAPEHGPRGGGGQQQVERFGGGHQQVRRCPPHGRPLGGRGVPGADGHGEVRGRKAESGRLGGDAIERHLQVLVHVGGERPQRRDVDHARPAARGGARRVGTAAGMGPVGGVDGNQKPGQGLAGAGGGGDQHVPARSGCAATPPAAARSVPPGSVAGTTRPRRDGRCAGSSRVGAAPPGVGRSGGSWSSWPRAQSTLGVCRRGRGGLAATASRAPRWRRRRIPGTRRPAPEEPLPRARSRRRCSGCRPRHRRRDGR